MVSSDSFICAPAIWEGDDPREIFFEGPSAGARHGKMKESQREEKKRKEKLTNTFPHFF